MGRIHVVDEVDYDLERIIRLSRELLLFSCEPDREAWIWEEIKAYVRRKAVKE